MGIGAYTPSGQEMSRVLHQGRQEQKQDRKRRRAEIRGILREVSKLAGRNTGCV